MTGLHLQGVHFVFCTGAPGVGGVQRRAQLVVVRSERLRPACRSAAIVLGFLHSALQLAALRGPLLSGVIQRSVRVSRLLAGGVSVLLRRIQLGRVLLPQLVPL